MTTVFRIETGRVDPRASAVGRIAKVLELDLRTLWTEDAA
jgi:predicted transcriptional regulator